MFNLIIQSAIALCRISEAESLKDDIHFHGWAVILYGLCHSNELAPLGFLSWNEYAVDSQSLKLQMYQIYDSMAVACDQGCV